MSLEENLQVLTQIIETCAELYREQIVHRHTVAECNVEIPLGQVTVRTELIDQGGTEYFVTSVSTEGISPWPVMVGMTCEAAKQNHHRVKDKITGHFGLSVS